MDWSVPELKCSMPFSIYARFLNISHASTWNTQKDKCSVSWLVEKKLHLAERLITTNQYG